MDVSGIRDANESFKSFYDSRGLLNPPEGNVVKAR